MVAQIVSADVAVSDLWPRCAIPIVLLVDGQRMSVALRMPEGDRVVYDSDDGELSQAERPQVEPDSIAGAVLDAADTVVREVDGESNVGVAIRFGRQVLGAIVVEGIPDESLEYIPLLESCALYVAARIDHENAVEKSERYARLALIDSLTGIANRRKFDETLANEWSRAARDGTPLALVILDLDFFKQFNDSYGHQAGDLCLQQVAQALSECIRRPADLLARYGGEEFVALLPSTELAGATALAEAMRARLAEVGIAHIGTSLGHVSLSAGVAAALPKPGSPAEELVRAADAALYEAKLAGRNRVVAQDYVSEAPPAHDVAGTSPTNLPIIVSRLVGRRAEVSDVRALLEEHRLVTVLGFSGTGKTRIALAVAAEVLDRYNDGVWIVDLGTVTDAMLVPATIGGAFGANIPVDTTALDALTAALSEKQALLLIENCEDLVEAAATTVAALLRDCPSLRVLTTSREPLDLPGEMIYRLPLLSLPPRPADLGAEEAIRADAVALFVERAQIADQNFELTDANAPAVAEIVHRLDGIALAIELATARLADTNVDALCSGLDERFRLLTGGDRAALPRRQTLGATIDWSYELLDPVERVVFRRLAIFTGSFTLESAAVVCSDDVLGVEPVFELVLSLVRLSFVGAETDGGEDRYFLLEQMREYARERLIEAGEYDVLADRHAGFMLMLAEQLESRHKTMSPHVWRAAAERNLPNFRAALEWTLGTRTDVSRGAALAIVLAPLFAEYSAGEGIRWLRIALAQLEPGREADLEARLRLRLATAPVGVPAAEQREAAERALALYRRLDDRAGLANALRTYAQVLAGSYAEEREFADRLACEAIQAARTVNDPLLLAECLGARSLTIDPADVAGKRGTLGESLTLYKMFGNDREIARALVRISVFEFQHGERARALDYCRDAVRYARASGNRELQENAARNLTSWRAGTAGAVS